MNLAQSKARGGSVAGALALATVLSGLFVATAVPLAAQTGLLVTADSSLGPGAGLVSAMEEAVAGVAWRRGPVRWAGSSEDLGAAIRRLRESGSNDVLVLVLTDAGGPSPTRGPARSGPGLFERTLALGAAELSSTVTIARAIERAAAHELAVLIESGDVSPGAGAVHELAGLNVTAARSPVEGFDTPRPVSVVQQQTIGERLPNNASDLFTGIPGLDVEGVGTNQTRPMIRGLRGQRVLMLEEGLRLNNSRRRLDSGEPPAVAGLFELERVEIVRGATSVLYGSDAIGGVVNLVPRSAGRSESGGGAWGARGALQYRHSTGDRQNRVSGTVSGGSGKFGFRAGASWRHSDAYDAPSGTFGDLSLERATRVQDTGVEDYNLGARLQYELAENHSVFARVERYRALDAGFGFVEPEDLGTPGPRIRLMWPDFRFDRLIAGYEGRDLGLIVADRVDLKAYTQSNERTFITDFFLPAGPGISTVSENFTDIDTNGLRLEAAKLLGGRHVLTYGVDLYRDASFNTDRRTRAVGPAPPTIDETPSLPNARLTSVGLFAQDAFALGARLDLTLGVRWQGVTSKTLLTENLDEPLTEATDGTLVGAANLLYRAGDAVNLIGSIGRGFRSPNLIERFFTGDTPDGTGRWVRNPDLGAETSLSVDVGTRVTTGALYAEGFLFGNFLSNGIQLRPTGDQEDGVPTFHNVNISSIDIRGVEVTAGIEATPGLLIEAGYTHVDATNPDDEDDLVQEGYRDRLNGRVRYSAADRYWLEYQIRFSGRTDRITPGVSPVGDEIPSFTVMSLRGGLRILGRNRLTLGVENLGNVLYAEPINVSFFRPSPRRQLVVSWTSEF